MLWVGAVIGLSVGTPEVAASAGLIWLFPLTFQYRRATGR
jgi:TctA family transporter